MPDEVKKTQLSIIKISKSIGFDSILNCALKELSNIIAKPIRAIFKVVWDICGY